jgi:hypothetical protein
MANPFDFLSGLIGGGQGGSTQSAPAAAQSSPFDNFFDPSNTSTPFANMMGTLGKAMGVPTQQERQASADASIMQKLSGLMQQTGSPQSAILKFMQDPDGVSLMSRPGAVDTLKRWTDSITPPPITAINTPAGTQSTLQQNGKQIGTVSQPPTEAQNMRAGVPAVTPLPPGGGSAVSQNGQVSNGPGQPTSEVQNFSALSRIAATDPQSILGVLAKNALSPNEIQQKALAVQQLVKTGVINQDQGDKINAGVLKPIQQLNEAGEPTGQWAMIDLANGTATPLLGPGGQPLSPPAGTGGNVVLPSNAPGAPPYVLPQGAINPDGSINSNKLTGLKYMGFGSGVLPAGIALAGHIVRQIDTGNQEEMSQLASIRHQQIDALESSISALGSAEGGRLKTNTQLLLDLVPSKFTSPVDAYNDLAILHGHVDQLIANETANLNRAKSGLGTHKEIETSRKTLDLLQNVLSTLPTMAEISQMQADIKQGTASQMVTPGKAGAAALDMIGKGAGAAVSGVGEALGGEPTQQNAAPDPATFKTMQPRELAAAGKALPPGPSDARDAYEARLRELGAGKKKPTTGKGNPPAPADNGNTTPSGAPLNYDLQKSSKAATPPLEDWLQNPAGERNLLYKGPNDTIKGAKWGSDNQWHVEKDGKWYTIVPTGGKGRTPGNEGPL